MLDHDVLAFDVAQLAQPLPEFFVEERRHVAQEPDPGDLPGLFLGRGAERCGDGRGQRGEQEAAAVHAGMLGRAANQVKCTARQEKPWPRARTSIWAGMGVLVQATRHAGPAVARPPDDRPVNAGVQIATTPVLEREGVQVGQ
jgi:hypothetical protein